MWHDNGESNDSTNPDFEQVMLGRRRLLGQALVAGIALVGMPLISSSARGARAAAKLVDLPRVPLDFVPIAMNNLDTVTVPNGYTARTFLRWGDAVEIGSPAFRSDATNTAADQALQCGMHNDGMHYFPFEDDSDRERPIYSSSEGVLCINHEYTDDGLLHSDGMVTWTAEKVAKSKAAHGMSVVHIRKRAGQWTVVPSYLNRRITADTPMRLSGPAAGDRLMVTTADPKGLNSLGTLNNCAHGYTPWGTYLTCEENFNGYFVNRSGAIPAEQNRYGITASGGGYRWHEFDTRFDAALNPNEPNRFGWVVEVDPFDPKAVPKKRTALGRMKHEGATVALAESGQIVVYMGDDERFEYIYKFVSRDRVNPFARSSNFDLLDNGVLYAARFNSDGSGEWLALVFGENGLTPANGFANQADVLVRTRQAADRAGATKMDRPEWVAVNPITRQVYCTLTNNSQRGTDGRAAVDAANPRAVNNYGQIIRWDEAGGDLTAKRFNWDLLALAGDPASSDPAKRGNVRGDAFGSPDGLWCDPRGILWVQTDVSTATLGRGDYTNFPNNQMLALDPVTGEYKRFMVGPRGCEITGITMTPDGRSMFVNIQHPGEPASERSDPANVSAVSSWPDGSGRPRSSTVVITRDDGRAIGSSQEFAQVAVPRRLIVL